MAKCSLYANCCITATHAGRIYIHDCVLKFHIHNVILLTVTVRLKAVQQQITVYNDTLAVELGCDMAGYVRPDDHLNWFREEEMITQDSKYELEFRNGSQTAQGGGSTTTPSRLSVVRILNPEMEDIGVYKCVINGTELTSHVELVVLKASGKHL